MAAATRQRLDLSKYTDLHYDTSKNNYNSLPVYGPFDRLFLSDWGQSDIHYDITQAFAKMNISSMFPLQKYSFSYLMNNYNAAMIGFSKGKSTSYLVSIFSLIMNNSDNDDDYDNMAPKAIILSSSLGSCFELENLSKHLLCLSKHTIDIVVACSSIPIQKTIAALCNGCDVLISTPSSLYDLLLKFKLFSWSNLKHIVYDNIDLLLENYRDRMLYFSRIISTIKENNNDLQMIAASVKWTNEMHTFLSQQFVKWQYIFGSHLESARYINVRFNVVHVEDNKLEKIAENLKYNVKWHRCVLVTTNPQQLSEIFNYIKQSDSEIEILLPNDIRSSKIYTVQKWNSSLVDQKLLMICSDDMLHDFYIDDADCLIHYDVPDLKKLFVIRFSVLQDYNHTDTTISLTKRERSTYIYISNSNKDMLQWPKIIETIKQFGDGIAPPVLMENSKLIKQILEKQKKHSPLCVSMMQFGYCPKPTTCKSRHFILKEIDIFVDNIPRSGLAIVEILHVYNATHLSVRLLKYTHTNNLNEPVQKWVTLSDFSDTIDEGLCRLYTGHNSSLHSKNPVVGDMVAVRLHVKQRMNVEFYRATVVGFLDTNTLNPKVTVKLIDLGYVDAVSKWNVYTLPEKWKQMPTTTADVFVASVKPIDIDKTWCLKADLCVKRELQFATDCNSMFIVDIKMVLGTNLWVKKLYKKFINPVSNAYDFEPILPDILYNKEYADYNSEHIEQLKNLCHQAGIEMMPLPLNKKLNLEDFMTLYKLPQPQWAHLDERSVNNVTIEFVISPKSFFVVNCKYYDQVSNLAEQISKFVNDKKVNELKHIINGALCLAKFPDSEEYSRGQIIDSQISGDCIEIFFVDVGQFAWIKADTLLTIHPDLITQLPFQAIECGLSGVKDELLPTGEEREELCLYVLDSLQDPACLMVVDSCYGGQYTDGNHYKVILYDEFIYLNFEFMEKFGQYCDCVEMDKLKSSIENKSTCSDNDNGQHPGIEKTDTLPYGVCREMFDEDDTLPPSQLETLKMFYKQFGMNSLGPMYEELTKMCTENEKVSNKEDSATITEILEPVVAAATESRPNKSLATTASGEKSNDDVQCVAPVGSALLADHRSLEKRKLKLNLKRQNVCLSCIVPTKSVIVPVCVWYQDSNSIYLKFNILEIDEHRVHCTTDNITFNAQFKGTLYVFSVDLYASIVVDSVTHKMNYEGFHIKADKLYKTDYRWSRLFSCKKYHRYIKYNEEQIKAPSNRSAWSLSVNKLKMMALNLPLNQPIDSDEDSEASQLLDPELFDDNFTVNTS